MKATTFTARRLPDPGDWIFDTFTMNYVEVIEVDTNRDHKGTTLWVADDGVGVYGRDVRYFKWDADYCVGCGVAIEPEARYFTSAGDPRHMLCEGFDEPPGAGDDPYGRPDPQTNPEFWTE